MKSTGIMHLKPVHNGMFTLKCKALPLGIGITRAGKHGLSTSGFAQRPYKLLPDAFRHSTHAFH